MTKRGSWTPFCGKSRLPCRDDFVKTGRVPKLIMMRGLPASGKTTWARGVVAESQGRCKRVCKDDLRDMLDAGLWSAENEEYVLRVRDSLVNSFLGEGLDVIVDDTNLHPKHERRLREIARGRKASFAVRDFTYVPLDECIRRDSQRERRVGPDVIRSMYDRFLADPRGVSSR